MNSNSKVKHSRGFTVLAGLLMATAMSGMVLGSFYVPAAKASDEASPHRSSSQIQDFDGLVQSISPSVVSIVSRIQETERSSRRIVTDNTRIMIPGAEVHRIIEATGSGFIIDKDGTIVTNNHVVGNATTVTVYLSDGREIPARVIGRDLKTDIAVLRIREDNPVPFVNFGDSDKVKPGQWAIAVGNPFGLGESVTFGFISARSRNIGNGYYGTFLQVDAPINQGNSGGPLFDKNGLVVGMNTAIFSPTGGSVGIGFAIPSNTVRDVVDQIIKDGKVTRAWLGIDTQMLDHTMASALGLKGFDKPFGVVVVSVAEKSPASAAGLIPGDIITHYNGSLIQASQELSQAIGEMKPGSRVELAVIRDGKEKTVTAELGLARDESEQVVTQSAQNHALGHHRVGLGLEKLTPEIRDELSLPETLHGVIVSGVEIGSPAEMAGLHPGDIILAVGSHPVRSPEEAKAVIGTDSEARHALALRIFRDGEVVYVAVDMKNNEENE